MTFETRYAQWARRSGELFEGAGEIIPGGAGSSARTVKFGWKPYPPFIAEGSGSRLRDVDGHEYVDYLLGLGPMILGHRHPVVTKAVCDAVNGLGTCFGLPYELEIEAAHKVVEAVPSVEMVRFTNSGSEAVGTAVRLARAFTGRRILVRFEGHYHGWQDVVYWSNHVDPAAAGPAARPRPVAAGPGVPLELADTLEVLTWNDGESFQRLMDERGHEIAAVITEPAVFNTGCILPEPGYLEHCRELCDRYGVILTFDEVLTAFRMAPGGAQEYLGVVPDLCVLGKALGAGMPISALAGRRAIMRQLRPVGHSEHSGTYLAHLTAVLAARAALEEYSSPGFYERLDQVGRRFYTAFDEIIASSEVPVVLQHVGPRFGLYFGLRGRVTNYREAAVQDFAMMRTFIAGCIRRGVYVHVSPHHGYSAAHTEQEVDRALEGIEGAMADVRREHCGDR